MKVGEIFGFPVYASASLPPGEIACVGVQDGLEVTTVDGVVVLRRRVAAYKVVGMMTPSSDEQLELLE